MNFSIRPFIPLTASMLLTATVLTAVCTSKKIVMYNKLKPPVIA